MSYGLRTYNPQGQLAINISDRLTRFYATVFSATMSVAPSEYSWSDRSSIPAPLKKQHTIYVPGVVDDGTWAATVSIHSLYTTNTQYYIQGWYDLGENAFINPFSKMISIQIVPDGIKVTWVAACLGFYSSPSGYAAPLKQNLFMKARVQIWRY
jgi:hypothetical protein